MRVSDSLSILQYPLDPSCPSKNLRFLLFQPEGKRPIFDREEIRDWDTVAAAEKRSINLVGTDRSRSPRKRGEDLTQTSSRMRQDGNADSGSVRNRLGQKRARSREGSPNYGRRRRLDGEGNGSGGGPFPLDARDRLNRQRRRNDFDPNRVLDREELESRRPDIKPWDINPEFVPKGNNYFEVGLCHCVYVPWSTTKYLMINV